MTVPLAARNLSVRYETAQGSVHGVRHVDIEAEPGEVSASSAEAAAEVHAGDCAGSPPRHARVDGSIHYWRQPGQASIIAARCRGGEIALVLQNPMTAFNPVLTIGDQLVDFQHRRRDLSRAQKKARIAAMLTRVGIRRCVAAHGRLSA